jgi:hypothetical protein
VQLGGEAIEIAGLAVFVAEEAGVTAREDHRLRPEPIGDDELRHPGTEPTSLVRLVDRLGERHRALTVEQDRCERRLVRDERPNLFRVLRNELERVHRATAAGEEVDRACAKFGDEAMQIVRMEPTAFARCTA